ncbi:hypoxanthine phosphoribosyltransferase [candidate division GN15 bacterium]|jgi:hypoxanthine phosphoribosyltransferase|nr:hypoxanthine phosphoribosyltransferase [candidate division GN15 bacterium]
MPFKPIERLIDEEKIQKRVAELGQVISRDYAGKEPVMVGVLKGCLVFMSDLIRHINLPLEVEFISAASYRKGVHPDKNIEIADAMTIELSGRDILVVEGIVETGRTVSRIVQRIRDLEPASVEIVTLLDKPSAHRPGIELKYKGFKLGNEFVVGYGLDNTQKFRNLPYIGRVSENP